MKRYTRILIATLAVLVLAVMLSSMIYIVAAADHDCRGEDCAVCLQIASCETFLKGLGLTTAVAIVAVFLKYSQYQSLLPSPKQVCILTLVSLKVKLSN